MKNTTCLTTDDIVAMLKKKQGKQYQKDFAANLGITASQLSDIYTGRRAIFNDKVMAYLGIKREVHFISAK